MAGVARQLHTQQVHYLRKRVTRADRGVAAGVLVGTLPAGAIIIGAFAKVGEVFNAGTTNTLNVGTTPTGGEVIPTATVLPTALGFKTSAVASALTFTADTDIYASYVEAGTPSTTGIVDIVVTFVINNDG